MADRWSFGELVVAAVSTVIALVGTMETPLVEVVVPRRAPSL